jgi:RNA methyltransferase, TrmH family
MKRLSSRHHPLVSLCRDLARGRDGEHRMLLDGFHLVVDARRAGVRLSTLAMTARVLASQEGSRLASAADHDATELLEVTDQMMEAMSPVTTPSGVVAIAERPASSLDRIVARSPALVVVAFDVQEPGNVGAIVRSAEAGGATGVVFCGTSADPFGWKALRGSMGSALRVPLLTGVEPTQVLSALRAAGVRVVATVPRGGTPLNRADLGSGVAFLLGGEGAGLSPSLISGADVRVTIPMAAPVESLNVAVAAALLVYEASRQRDSNALLS